MKPFDVPSSPHRGELKEPVSPLVASSAPSRKRDSSANDTDARVTSESGNPILDPAAIQYNVAVHEAEEVGQRIGACLIARRRNADVLAKR